MSTSNEGTFDSLVGTHTYEENNSKKPTTEYTLGTYVTVHAVNVRESKDVRSAKVAKLPKGEDVEVVELRVYPSGCVRVRIASPAGWTSIISTNGKQCLAPHARVIGLNTFERIQQGEAPDGSDRPVIGINTWERMREPERECEEQEDHQDEDGDESIIHIGREDFEAGWEDEDAQGLEEDGSLSYDLEDETGSDVHGASAECGGWNEDSRAELCNEQQQQQMYNPIVQAPAFVSAVQPAPVYYNHPAYPAQLTIEEFQSRYSQLASGQQVATNHAGISQQMPQCVNTPWLYTYTNNVTPVMMS